MRVVGRKPVRIVGRSVRREKIYALRFNHKMVVLKLTNGEELRGKLHWSNANPYEVILETDEGEILVFKHAILYLKEAHT